MPELLQFVFSGPDRRRRLCAGRARLHADLQRLRRHQLRPGRVRHARRHDDGVPRAGRACRCRSRPARDRRDGRVGLALHRFAIEPARGASAVALIIITIGASIFLRGAAQVVFDKRFHSLPPFVRHRCRSASAAPPSCRRAWWCSPAPSVIVVLLWLFIDRTLFGKAMLATAANRLAARLVGIDTARDRRLVLRASAAIGAVAGILITPDHARPATTSAPLLALKGFAAAMLGGMGSALGAVVGGLLARIARGLRRRLSVLAVQGRGRVPGHPARAVRHAAAACSARARSSGYERAPLLHHRLARLAGDRRPGRRPAAAVLSRPPTTTASRALVFVFALAALGLNLLMGFAGQVSLGHAGFMGIGAYAVAIGPTHLGVPSWLSFIAGAALSALVAFVVGRPILRLKGHYLAVATLGFGLLLAIVLHQRGALDRRSRRHVGAAAGALRLCPPRSRTPGTGSRPRRFLIGAVLAHNLIDSPTGRALRAIHDSEVAARVLGVDVAKKKLAVFVVSAVYASVAGSYLALLNGHITPDVSGFLRSIELVAMVVLGGMGSVARLARRRRPPGGAAADADRAARLRAHGARPHRDGRHDLPARRHRAGPRERLPRGGRDHPCGRASVDRLRRRARRRRCELQVSRQASCSRSSGPTAPARRRCST